MAKPLITSMLLLLVAACGGESGDPAKQLRRFCERWNDARCAMADECVGWLGATCSSTCDDPEWQRTFERLEQGRVSYNAIAAMQCLDGMKPGSCGEPWPCRNVVVGVVPPGGACGLGEDCAGEAICQVDGSCPGICLALPGPGDACVPGGPSCRSGSFCHAFDGRCLAFVEEGGGCDGDSTSALILDPGQPRPPDPDQPRQICEQHACIDGRCTPKSPLPEVGAGEACWAESCADGDCRLKFISYCREGLFCNWDTYVCTRPGTIDEPCPGSEFIVGSGACVHGLTCFDSRCTPIAEDGDACDAGSCPGGLICIENRCSRYPAVGEACVPGVSFCEPSRYSPMFWYPVSTYCDADREVCVETVLGGEPCDGGNGICDGICEDGVCQAYACAP